MYGFKKLLTDIRACRLCEADLPLGPNPVLRADPAASILIVGQAPGIRVHKTGIPWNDPSGDRLRQWMGINKELFYDEKRIAIVPMGFCYPGTGKFGDLPPRKECAETWHDLLLGYLKRIRLTILCGKYSQDFFLNAKAKKNLTETVKAWKEYWPTYLPLPHPSPRNNIWLKTNPWFEKDVLPTFRRAVHKFSTSPKSLLRTRSDQQF